MDLKAIAEIPAEPLSSRYAVFKRDQYKDAFGVMTYDEVIELANDAEKTLKLLPVHDPAWEHYQTSRYHLIGYATAIDAVDKLGRTDHLFTVKAMVAFKDEVAEVELLFNRQEAQKSRQPDMVAMRCRKNLWDARLLKSGGPDVEVVIL